MDLYAYYVLAGLREAGGAARRSTLLGLTSAGGGCGRKFSGFRFSGFSLLAASAPRRDRWTRAGFRTRGFQICMENAFGPRAL